MFPCSRFRLLQTASDCFRCLTPFTFFNVFHLFHQGAQGAEGRMDRGTGGLPQALGSSAPEALSPGGCGGHHSHLEPSWSCQALPNGQFDLHILEALRTESDRVWQSVSMCLTLSDCLTFLVHLDSDVSTWAHKVLDPIDPTDPSGLPSWDSTAVCKEKVIRTTFPSFSRLKSRISRRRLWMACFSAWHWSLKTSTSCT